MKLIEKKKINSRYYKRYDTPKTRHFNHNQLVLITIISCNFFYFLILFGLPQLRVNAPLFFNGTPVADNRRKIEFGGLVIKPSMDGYNKAVILGGLVHLVQFIAQDENYQKLFASIGNNLFMSKSE